MFCCLNCKTLLSLLRGETRDASHLVCPPVLYSSHLVQRRWHLKNSFLHYAIHETRRLNIHESFEIFDTRSSSVHATWIFFQFGEFNMCVSNCFLANILGGIKVWRMG
ncbi:hypothetical protein CEXT_502951 [Caerostris extrusa]|uniref:Uncharacterized protein n=1 Tax=Caerostris extrusa TaxID=172846 RepID=A0AAV4PLQ3_CAEEX|nr:hypothetical protein CEXT_502951 [Caerostris extrusa]